MNTLGVYSIDNLSMNDLLVDEFNDTGTDVLGASDSILGGCDTYTSVMSRLVDTSVDVSGNAGASPYLVEAFGWDQVNNTDTGSSTLATSTHVYATDSFTYVEDSGGTATATQTYGSSVNGWTNFGTASDSYVDNDQGVITISDTATTSHDSFGLNDTHSISGYESSATSAVSASSSWYDHGQDEDAFAASGSDSSTGDQYTFSDAESAQDNFAVTNQVVSAYNGVATDFSDSTVTMTGSTSTGPSASSFSYSQSNTNSESISDYGNVTDGGVVTPFSESQASSATYRYSVTGPPVTTAYQESIISSTLTGNTPYPANFTQTVVAGHADTAGSAVAHNAGSAPANSAEHLGTTPNNLEGSGGLASAMGGFAVHSLLFAGPEVMAEVSSGGNSLVLQEAYSSSSPTNWVSHPTGIGYRRPAPANGGLPANSGNAPITDSGTADGSNERELARLTNFDTGGNENSTATQTAPTSRAEQQGGVTTATGAGPGGGPTGGNGGYYFYGGQWFGTGELVMVWRCFRPSSTPRGFGTRQGAMTEASGSGTPKRAKRWRDSQGTPGTCFRWLDSDQISVSSRNC